MADDRCPVCNVTNELVADLRARLTEVEKLCDEADKPGYRKVLEWTEQVRAAARGVES